MSDHVDHRFIVTVRIEDSTPEPDIDPDESAIMLELQRLERAKSPLREAVASDAWRPRVPE